MMKKSNLTADEAPGLMQVLLRSNRHRPSGEGMFTLDDVNPLRILIAVRDPYYKMLVMELLKVQPGLIVVDHAHDGLNAIEKIIEFKPHILLVSPNLSVINGIQIFRQVKGYPKTKSIRIIAITECRAPMIAKTIIDAGAEMCLQKPIDTSALLEAIRFQAHSFNEIQPASISPNDSKKRWQS